MAYRLFELHAVVGDDSNLQQVAFDRTATVWQVNDLEVAPPTFRVAPGDAADVQIALGTVAQGYCIALFSDYPIKLRVNSNSGTQLTLTTSNSPATNVGAPLPAKCFYATTALINSLFVSPIANAGQTATCWLVVTGDPLNAY